MVITFAMFATGADQSMKQLGVGLAAAILIDATIVRAVLLPAAMKLLGDRTWYLPKQLGWLPKFEHEPMMTPAAPDLRQHICKLGARHPAGAAAFKTARAQIRECRRSDGRAQVPRVAVSARRPRRSPVECKRAGETG